jgi:hypothetical protein
MPINHHEIIEDMEGRIRKCGGGVGGMVRIDGQRFSRDVLPTVPGG